MSKLIFTLLFLLVSSCWIDLFGQSFTAVPVDYRSQKISNSIRSFGVYRIDIKGIDQYVKKSNGHPELNIFVKGKAYDWTLIEHPMIRPETKGMTGSNGQTVPLSFDQTCTTFIGFRPGMGDEARFTISPRLFAAMMPDGEDRLYIQPLWMYEEGSDRDLVVIYHTRDVIPPTGRFCASPESPLTPVQENKKSGQPNTASREARTFSCREIEVSFATDSRMYDEFNEDEAAILDFNLMVMNLMEPYYDDFDLDFWVAEFYISTASIGQDPWGNATEVSDLQSDFGDWAYDHFDTEDMGHLWTAADLHHDQEYNIIGYASIGGACDDIGLYPWALLEDFNSNNLYLLSLLQAHEYGHLLDADHEPNTGTIMEPSLNDVQCSCWAQDNIEEMLDFMEDETCIESCVQCPVTYYIIDYIGWGSWKYSAIDHITSKAIIDGSADVIMQSIGYVKLRPGFIASTMHENSSGSTFIARVNGCE